MSGGLSAGVISNIGLPLVWKVYVYIREVFEHVLALDINDVGLGRHCDVQPPITVESAHATGISGLLSLRNLGFRLTVS